MLPYRCEDSSISNVSKCKNLKLFYQGEPIQKDTMDISLSLDKPIGPRETKNYSWNITVDPIHVEHASLQDLWMSAKLRIPTQGNDRSSNHRYRNKNSRGKC